jgi:hypothetical protein
MALPEWRNILAPASMARIFPAQSKDGADFRQRRRTANPRASSATRRSRRILIEIRQTRGDVARETGYELKRFLDYVRGREREAALAGIERDWSVGRAWFERAHERVVPVLCPCCAHVVPMIIPRCTLD